MKYRKERGGGGGRNRTRENRNVEREEVLNISRLLASELYKLPGKSANASF